VGVPAKILQRRRATDLKSMIGRGIVNGHPVERCRRGVSYVVACNRERNAIYASRNEVRQCSDTVGSYYWPWRLLVLPVGRSLRPKCLSGLPPANPSCVLA